MAGESPGEFVRRLFGGSPPSGLPPEPLDVPAEPSHQGDAAWLVLANPRADVATARFVSWLVETGRLTDAGRGDECGSGGGGGVRAERTDRDGDD